MMEQNKEVLRYCPNFQRIINFKYNDNDLISEKLLAIYRDFIFKANVNDDNDKKMVQDFDYVLRKYTDDYIFRKELKKEIVNVKIKRSCSDILREIVKSVLVIFNQYMFNTTRKITIARWI